MSSAPPAELCGLVAVLIDFEGRHLYQSAYQEVLKGGHLDLTELKIIYITEIYMNKYYKSSIIKNHKITKKKNRWCPAKMLTSLLSCF